MVQSGKIFSYKMDVTVTSHDIYFTPFYPHSVNIISASTNQGKSTLLQNIIKNRLNCFTRLFTRVVVVFCNEKVDSLPYTLLANSDLEVEIFYLDDFSTTSLNANDLVIFEDIVHITPVITEVINVLAHHLDLASVFVVCQCVYDNKFKVLLSLAHQLIIFLSGTQGTKLAQHIRQYFFLNSEIKDSFKQVISQAEKDKSVVLIKLNDIARLDQPIFFAISGIQHFAQSNQLPVIVYPQLNKEQVYRNMFNDNYLEVEQIPTLPKGSYLLVPAENVIKKTQKNESKSEKHQKEEAWEKLNYAIIDEIKSGLQYNRQRTALNIVKYMLNCKYFTFSQNGRSFMLTQQPSTLTSTIDYLDAASRMAGPNEISNPLFLQFTKILLDAKMPKIFVKNKNLLHGQKRNKRKQPKKLKMPHPYAFY